MYATDPQSVTVYNLHTNKHQSSTTAEFKPYERKKDPCHTTTATSQTNTATQLAHSTQNNAPKRKPPKCHRQP